jgi:nitrite reductase (NADH) small subunit
VQGCAVACPLHGWVIHLDTGEAEAPDEGQVQAVAVKLEDGRIWLATPKPCSVRKPEAA